MNKIKYCLFVSMFFFIILISSCATPEKIAAPPPKPAKIAVVLGAGASKGFAHIGVLKILELNKVPIHMVIGTSVGSFVGSLYAYGHSPHDLQVMAISLQRSDVVDRVVIPDNGFVKGHKLENFVNDRVKNTPMEKFKIPFFAVATNIQTGEEIVFSRGNAGLAVRASCSIPGIFQPPVIDNNMYVDGGVVSPLAIDAARRNGADVVIAVDVSSSKEATMPTGVIEIIINAINIMHSRLIALQIKNADVVIKPKLDNMSWSDFSKKHEAIMDGEKAALAALPAINAILSKLRQEGRLPSVN